MDQNEIKLAVYNMIAHNCVSTKTEIDAAVAARVSAMETSANQNASANEIELANREARKAELRLIYKANALVVIYENGSRDAIRQRSECAAAQRALGAALAAADDKVKQAYKLDKDATDAAAAAIDCDADAVEACETNSSKAALAAAQAVAALTQEEAVVFNNILVAKDALNAFLRSAKTIFLDKVGLDLGEEKKGFAECKILGLDKKAIGSTVTVTYKKTNGSIRDIRKA